MSWLIAQIKYRSKAAIVAAVTVLSAAAVAALQDPQIQSTVVNLIPVQYQSLAVLIIGAVVTAIVHQVRLGAKPVTATDEAPVTELAASPETTILQTVQADQH